MQYIYSRVSTDKQDNDNQLSRLKVMHPDAAVFEETASGAKSRPILKKLLDGLEKGDILIVAALDRLGRRTSEVLLIIEDLDRRGVILRSVREGVDYSTICGKLVTQILVSIAEMERGLISERTKMALAAKRKQGIVGGRRATYSPDAVEQVKRLRAEGRSVREVARLTGMSASRVSELTRSA